MNTTPRNRRVAAAVAALALAVGLAACGSSSSDGASSGGTTAAPTTAMADSTMTPTTAMAPTTAMGSAMADAPFGPACGSVPTSGAGSFDGMAKDPAATAASNNPVLSTLVAAVKAAGLVDTLNGPGPFTIFAPANDAFAKIDKATLDSLLAQPQGDLTKILTYHVVAGQQLDADALVKAGSVKTVQGGEVKVTKSGDTYMVDGAKVVCGNVKTANATVFIIDSVLMPPAA